ncbi:MAG: DegT/DnrJ/EryC1/StrS family aminotransferase [Leptospirales bacterium]|nr:DegT/DnrJ/EryC1/StrS family aminotransferase [Leptospirales bacterium]
MEFIDLKTQQTRINDDLRLRMNRVLEHGQYIMGPEVAELEKALAAYVGVKHCISLSSGTDALLLPLMALGVGPGDEVIVPAFTFIATAEVIALLKATPVFVDVEEKSYNVDPEKLKAAITSRTRAIIPVSLYGQIANIAAIQAAAGGIPVIEDAAQSFGATHNGKRSCSLTSVGATSFFPSKPLGCYGDAGACFTDDDDLADLMRRIRIHGQERRYYHTHVGINARIDTLQAAILLAKFQVFPDEVERRMRIGERYSDLLRGSCEVPFIEPGNTSVFGQYTIQVDDRETVQKKLQAAGVPTAVHYPLPLHLQPVFRSPHLPEGTFPIAESAARRVLSLPMHPYLSDVDQDQVVSAVKDALSVRA